MLESIRSHRRWMMFFLIVLVFPSFVVTGIYGYSRFVEGDNAVARVGGKPVTAQELDAAQRQRLEQFRRIMGSNFDPTMFETREARIATLDSVLAQRALQLEASKGYMVVSDDRLRQVIGSVPDFQHDGKFDYEQYKRVLTAQGRSELGFESELTGEIARQQLLQAVANSAVVPKALVERLNRITVEQREIRALRFEPAAYASKVAVTDDQISAHYEENRARFETPESMQVEYVVLSLDDVAADITVPEAELRTYYEQNKARYGREEERQARHILLTVGEGGTGKDNAEVRAKAEELVARLRKNPEEFPKLAREFSKDPGSAQKGGDLGFFGRNMMVPPFEQATYALKKGEISDVVETDFGFHIIQVTDIKPADVKPFDEVRAELDGEYRRQQAQKKFAEAAELFTNIVYEQADSLQPAADRLKLKIRTRDNLTRAGVPAPEGATQVFTPRVMQSLFSEDSIRHKRNTEAIEVAPNTLVSARVVEHRPAAVRPLAEVRDAVRAQVLQREAARLARSAGEERLAALRQKSDEAGFGAPQTISRFQPQGLPPGAVKAVMQVPADTLPAYVGAELDGGAYGVFHVASSKMPEDASAAQRDATALVVARQVGAADDELYLQALKRKYKAEVLRPELKPGATADAATDK